MEDKMISTGLIWWNKDKVLSIGRLPPIASLLNINGEAVIFRSGLSKACSWVAKRVSPEQSLP
mgnify:FL=1